MKDRSLISPSCNLNRRYYPDESYCKILPNCAIKNLEPKVIDYSEPKVPLHASFVSIFLVYVSRSADQTRVPSKRRGAVLWCPRACPPTSSRSIGRR